MSSIKKIVEALEANVNIFDPAFLNTKPQENKKIVIEIAESAVDEELRSLFEDSSRFGEGVILGHPFKVVPDVKVKEQ